MNRKKALKKLARMMRKNLYREYGTTLYLKDKTYRLKITEDDIAETEERIRKQMDTSTDQPADGRAY